MPIFEVSGRGRESGRRRKRLYTAPSDADATRQAEADGTIVESVVKVDAASPSKGTRAQLPGVFHLFTKVAGVTKHNADKSRRQEIIRRCRPGEPLALEHEETNRHDPNAVRVLRATGEQIGYLGRDLARDVVMGSARGKKYAAFVSALTGGGPGESVGVNLLIIVYEGGATSEDAQKYIDDLFAREPGTISPNRPPVKAGSGCLAGVAFALILVAIPAHYGWMRESTNAAIFRALTRWGANNLADLRSSKTLESDIRLELTLK